MVRKIHKINTLYALLAIVAMPAFLVSPALALESQESLQLQLQIAEVLAVSVTTPDSWAEGNIDMTNGSDLLRNKIVLNVTSNNASGFTASMFSKNTTNLVNQTKSTSTIPTLSSATTAAAFPVNYWGYSIDDTDAGLETANYSALQTSAITLASLTTPSTYSEDIFFGARADVTKDSGTYANTVVFSVVSAVDTNTDNPVVPDDPDTPVTPSDPTDQNNTNSNPNANIAYLNGNDSSENDGESETIKNNSSSGDVSNSYAEPQGVTTTNIGAGSPLATGLAITAGAAAASGIFFFILAKRKKDDEEEDEQQL